MQVTTTTPQKINSSQFHGGTRRISGQIENQMHNIQYLADDQFSETARRGLVGTGRARDQDGHAYRIVRGPGPELFVRVH